MSKGNKTIIKRSTYIIVKKVVDYKNKKPVVLYSYEKKPKPVQLSFPFPELSK